MLNLPEAKSFQDFSQPDLENELLQTIGNDEELPVDLVRALTTIKGLELAQAYVMLKRSQKEGLFLRDEALHFALTEQLLEHAPTLDVRRHLRLCDKVSVRNLNKLPHELARELYSRAPEQYLSDVNLPRALTSEDFIDHIRLLLHNYGVDPKIESNRTALKAVLYSYFERFGMTDEFVYYANDYWEYLSADVQIELSKVSLENGVILKALTMKECGAVLENRFLKQVHVDRVLATSEPLVVTQIFDEFSRSEIGLSLLKPYERVRVRMKAGRASQELLRNLNNSSYGYHDSSIVASKVSKDLENEVYSYEANYNELKERIALLQTDDNETKMIQEALMEKLVRANDYMKAKAIQEFAQWRMTTVE